jgi:hypothetical protein
MADNEILIKIQTAYESGGIEAVKKAIADTEKETKNLGNSNSELERKTTSSNRELNNSQRALAGLNSASAASRGSFQGLSQTLEVFGGNLATLAAKASLVAGAFTAGFSIGTAIDKWLGISDAISKALVPAEKFVSIQDRIKAKLGDLDAASLAAVKKEFDSLTVSLESTFAGMEKINSIKNELMGKETAAQLAETEANMPPGPARDKALLAKREERELASIEERRNQARAKLAAAEEARKSAQDAVVKAETTEEARARIVANQFPSDPLEDRVLARRRLEAARQASSAARSRMAPIDEVYGNTRADTYNTMRGLALEERAVRARSTSQRNEISITEQKAAAEKQKADAEKQKADQDALIAAKIEHAETQLTRATTPAKEAALIRQIAVLRSQQIDRAAEPVPAAPREVPAAAPREVPAAPREVSAALETIALRKSTLGLQTAKSLAERVGGAKYHKYQSLESDAEKEQREADAARGRIDIYSSALKSARSGSPEARKAQQSLSSAKTDYSKEVAEANAARAAAAQALKEVSSALRDIGADINILRDQFKNRDN